MRIGKQINDCLIDQTVILSTLPPGDVKSCQHQHDAQRRPVEATGGGGIHVLVIDGVRVRLGTLEHRDNYTGQDTQHEDPANTIDKRQFRKRVKTDILNRRGTRLPQTGLGLAQKSRPK